MNINATLLGQAITFAILVWFTMRFVWPPLMKALEDRARKISEGLAAAEQGRRDLALAETRAKEVLGEAREQAQDFVAHAQKRADEIVEEAKTNGKLEGERQIALARANIEQETHQARERLRAEVAALAIAGAEQILMREVDPATHRDVLAKLGAQL